MSNMSSSNGTSSIQNAKNAAVDSKVDTTAAYNAIASHPTTQNIKNSVANSQLANGPVAENVKDQTVKTQNEFSNLAAARTTPAQPAATGQQLTHYHSFFSSLLSWENPRASAIAYISLVLFIFGARYLNLLRYAFKLTWMTLGVTVLAEVAGKTILGHGLASNMRPRKYYVLPRETLDAVIGDVHELVNFFVIESQRVLFAENVFASIAVFLSSFLAYYLIKIVPFWGLTLIATTVAFIVPLVYTSNQELIDHHIQNASNVVNQQTAQVKQIATHHATAAANTTKQYVGDYSAKAQDLITSRGRSSSPVETTKAPIIPLKSDAVNSAAPAYNSTAPTFKPADFPIVPKEEFKTVPSVGTTTSTLRNENDPLIAT